jgi:hypothetical protein
MPAVSTHESGSCLGEIKDRLRSIYGYAVARIGCMEGDLWPCRRQDRLYQRRSAGKSPPLAKFKGEWHDLDMDWRDAK